MRIFLWKGVMEGKKEYSVEWEVLAQARVKGVENQGRWQGRERRPLGCCH